MIYLQHRGLQERTDKAKIILLYALWVSYALSVVIIIIEILRFCWIDLVSMDDHHCLTFFFQLVLQSIEILYHFQITQGTIFAFCDVMAQFILVRTADNAYPLFI